LLDALLDWHGQGSELELKVCSEWPVSLSLSSWCVCEPGLASERWLCHHSAPAQPHASLSRLLEGQHTRWSHGIPWSISFVMWTPWRSGVLEGWSCFCSCFP
jgi:hypothetical protein